MDLLFTKLMLRYAEIQERLKINQWLGFCPTIYMENISCFVFEVKFNIYNLQAENHLPTLVNDRNTCLRKSSDYMENIDRFCVEN